MSDLFVVFLKLLGIIPLPQSLSSLSANYVATNYAMQGTTRCARALTADRLSGTAGRHQGQIIAQFRERTHCM
jgi:hypothetical protein